MRINRAADDAAGLAISDTLRAQISGMHQASANSQDAINLVQTAEGGLEATSNILNRMRELSVQAGNDSYSQADREKIQTEVGQLTEELNRISYNTAYNSRVLLDGTIAQSASQRDGTAVIAANTRVGGPNAAAVPVFGDLFTGVSLTNAVTTSVDAAMQFQIVATATAGIFNLQVRGSDGTVSVVSDITNGTGLGTNLFAGGVTRTFTLTSGGLVSLSFGNVAPTIQDVGDVATVQVTGRQAPVLPDSALTFQTGQNEGQIIKFGIIDTRATSLHLEGISVFGSTDLASRVQSQNAIGVIDEAMRKINIERAHIGAFQNRLEHSLANLEVASENLSQSNSRIRDTDVALESAALTRGQILVQAGTAMLSQANAVPQNALSLLRG